MAPVGEVVRTRVEGEDRDGRGGPIFDNLRDLPLANDFPSSSQPDPTTPNPNLIQTTQPIQGSVQQSSLSSQFAFQFAATALRKMYHFI